MIKHCYIGVDPGTSGAIACIHEEGVEVMAFPIAGKAINLTALSNWVYNAVYSSNRDAIACIEKVGAMPGQGVTSTFTFGFSTGCVHGVLAALGIPIMLVTPQAWKKEILAGTAKDKLAAIDYCWRLYPQVSLYQSSRAKQPNSNIADALCIATYCWVKYRDFRQ